jgi:ketosteroid isomerase-like protein
VGASDRRDSDPLTVPCYGPQQWGATKGDSMSLTVEELAMAYHGAWVELDPDTIIALHSADSVFHMHGAAQPATGKDAVKDLIVTLLRLVPDLKFEPKRLYSRDDHIVFEYDMSGTFDRSPFVCDGVDVIAVSEGLVTRKNTYLDYVKLTEQIGEMPTIGAVV